jgi:hypothetical protein
MFHDAHHSAVYLEVPEVVLHNQLTPSSECTGRKRKSSTGFLDLMPLFFHTRLTG